MNKELLVFIRNINSMNQGLSCIRNYKTGIVMVMGVSTGIGSAITVGL